MEYPSEFHLKLISREISFVHNLFISFSIVVQFCTEHGNDSAVFVQSFKTIGQLKRVLLMN